MPGRRLHFFFLFFLAWLAAAPAVGADKQCEQFYAHTTRDLETLSWTREEKERALSVMLSGSQKVSRTVAKGRRFMAPAEVKDHDIMAIGERNFQETARFVINHFAELPLNKQTAVLLNRMLTKDLVPTEDWGNYLYRPISGYSHATDPFVSGKPDNFYAWLDSPKVMEASKLDPVAFAEKLHHNLAAMDSFPDGNGRLSRLFADLALIRAGKAPAFYTTMEDYFARGNARSNVAREEKVKYFREAVLRGSHAITSGEGLSP